MYVSVCNKHTTTQPHIFLSRCTHSHTQVIAAHVQKQLLCSLISLTLTRKQEPTLKQAHVCAHSQSKLTRVSMLHFRNLHYPQHPRHIFIIHHIQVCICRDDKNKKFKTSFYDYPLHHHYTFILCLHFCFNCHVKLSNHIILN